MPGLEMKYFVLNPTKDNEYGTASRKAIRVYAEHIGRFNKKLADDLADWLNRIYRTMYIA